MICEIIHGNYTNYFHNCCYNDPSYRRLLNVLSAVLLYLDPNGRMRKLFCLSCCVQPFHLSRKSANGNYRKKNVSLGSALALFKNLRKQLEDAQ